jgi:hypothetical protein
MGLRSWVKRLERDSREEMERFELLHGGTYYYDPLETDKILFGHACDVQLGERPEPPEIYRKICEAKDPAAVLERLRPEDPERAFVNPAELYDVGALVNERRLALHFVEPVEDLSE